MQYGSAATGQVYLSPGSASINNGETRSFQVRVHPNTGADSVNTTISYDRSKLQFISISDSGSAFTIPLSQTGGGGTVNIQRGILGSLVSGDSLVASVKFKALAGNGSTTLNISGYTLGGGTEDTLSPKAASVNLTSPSTPSSPTPNDDTPTSPSGGDGSSGGSSNDGGSSDSPSGSDDGSAQDGQQNGSNNDSGSDNKDVINIDVKPRRLSMTRVAMEVTTSKQARVHIMFGTEQDQIKASTATSKFGRKHIVGFRESLLIPGTTFYYKVIAEDRAGNVTETGIESFKTRGFTVRLLVVDKFDRRVKNSKVKLFSEPMEGTTDEEGRVTFQDVAPGNHHIEYEQDGQVYSQTIKLSNVRIRENDDGDQKAEAQSVTARLGSLEFKQSRTPAIVPTAIAASLLLALAGAFVIIRRRRADPLVSSVSTSLPTQQQPLTPTEDDQPPVAKAQGVDKPDPGSIINPRHDNQDDN